MTGQMGLAGEAKEMQSRGGRGRASGLLHSALHPFLFVSMNKEKKAKSLDIMKKMKTIPRTKKRGKSPMPKSGEQERQQSRQIVASPKSNNLWPEETKLIKITKSQLPRTTTSLKEYSLQVFNFFFLHFLENPDYNVHSAEELLISISIENFRNVSLN